MKATPISLGLTGSIGMGKSTTLKFFKEAGAAVWDADEAVARLYAPGSEVTERFAALWPDIIQNGVIDRQRLRKLVQDDPSVLPKIEEIVHPLVAADRKHFLESTESDLAVCDIPLLFENGSETEFNAVVLVTAPAEVQRERVLARPGMTNELFETILAKQMPDAEKRKRADYIIDTSLGLGHARQRVDEIISEVKKQADA